MPTIDNLFDEAWQSLQPRDRKPNTLWHRAIDVWCQYRDEIIGARFDAIMAKAEKRPDQAAHLRTITWDLWEWACSRERDFYGWEPDDESSEWTANLIAALWWIELECAGKSPLPECPSEAEARAYYEAHKPPEQMTLCQVGRSKRPKPLANIPYRPRQRPIPAPAQAEQISLALF